MGALLDLTASEPGLWWSTITCTFAAYLCFKGAMTGIIAHRFPRMLVAVAVTVIAISYWVDLAGLSGAVDMRRGAGWLLWPALAWTAWSGIRYSRRVVAESQAVLDGVNGEDSG